MYNKFQIIHYLKKYGWNEKRHIDTSAIKDVYEHFFDEYEKDDYTTFVFTPYPPFQKVLEFWSSFGDLTIDFSGKDTRKKTIVINSDAVLNGGDPQYDPNSFILSKAVFSRSYGRGGTLFYMYR